MKIILDLLIIILMFQKIIRYIYIISFKEKLSYKIKEYHNIIKKISIMNIIFSILVELCIFSDFKYIYIFFLVINAYVDLLYLIFLNSYVNFISKVAKI